MSLKSLAAAGEVKKTDLFRARYQDLKIEKGFNLRDLTAPDVKAHINSIYTTLMNGGTVPPLDVRVDQDDNIFVVDGHCRHAAYGMAIEAGAPIEWIDVLPTKDNDAGRVTKMITRNQGLGLTPLETAMGYLRLIKFNWDEKQIANSVGRSEEHVKQLLILANANTDVHQLVRSGAIKAYPAIEVIRKYGDKAGEHIKQQLEAAQAQGKRHVTKSGMNGRALPKKIVSGLVETVQSFTQKLDQNTRRQLAELEAATEDQLKGKTVSIDAAALLELMRAQSAIDAVKAKQAEKAHAAEQAAKQVQIEA